LKGQPDQNVVIEGHTDSVGSEEYNLGLSQRRAEAVRMALVERGVRAEHVRAIGKGETSPVASNANTGGRQQNRRVEIIFPNGGQKVATDVD
jgi:outer membrane protein OmpA-like peptidoglycan-associated protein